MKGDGGTTIGVDWRIPLDVAWEHIGHDLGIQGNLDPAVLLGSRDVMEEQAPDVLRRAGGRPGHIFNLGHGVMPETPLDNSCAWLTSSTSTVPISAPSGSTRVRPGIMSTGECGMDDSGVKRKT